jgi:N-formylglutamate amidohydrolase
MLTGIEDGFVAQLPAVPVSPVVVSVPHAGISTVGFESGLSPELDVRCDADLFVDRLYRVGEPNAPSTFVSACLSRFVCDLNRDPDDVSPGAVPLHASPRNADGRGFIWAITTSGIPALSRPLTLDDWRARTSIHAAYHDAITRSLARARDRFGFAILVDGHSMPSRGRLGHKDPGRVRADVVPGDRDGQSCSPALSRLVGAHFADRGYSVAFNDPYKGGFITAHHGQPEKNIHAIQIELRRDLYMDENAFAIVESGFDRVRSTLDALLVRLETFTPE